MLFCDPPTSLQIRAHICTYKMTNKYFLNKKMFISLERGGAPCCQNGKIDTTPHGREYYQVDEQRPCIHGAAGRVLGRGGQGKA